MIEYVFIDESILTDYFFLQKQNSIEIYGKLQFSENTIDNVEASFVRQEYFSVPARSHFLMGAGGIKELIGETKIVEAEGKIIVKLTKIVKS